MFILSKHKIRASIISVCTHRQDMLRASGPVNRDKVIITNVGTKMKD